jgi:putative hydrolase of the HAD superfamily
MIKAVIFDFGRVISAQKPLSLFSQYEAELGLPAGTINSIMFDNPAWQEALVGRKTAGEFWAEIGPALGLRSKEAIEAFRLRYHADEKPDEEVIKLIRCLHGRYRLAVLSNSPPGLSQWLADWGILDLFDVVFCSGDEGVAKPDRAAFELTLERLGVAPEEALFIDDAPENVSAASALGLHTILFTDAGKLAEELVRLYLIDCR